MGKAEIQGLVSKLENEKAAHEQQCGGQPRHDSQLAKIAVTVRDLEAEMIDNNDNDTVRSTSGVTTARGDEFAKIDQLQNAAEELEGQNKVQEAKAVKSQMRVMVAKELNELDGFDR